MASLARRQAGQYWGEVQTDPDHFCRVGLSPAESCPEEALAKKFGVGQFPSGLKTRHPADSMNQPTRLVVFELDQASFALPLREVHRVVHAAEVTPLPNAPRFVLGAINIAGEILPVLCPRRRLGLPARTITPTDQFLIAQAGPRKVVLAVDRVREMLETPATEIVSAATVAPHLDQVRGFVKLNHGLILIQDLEKFLSLEEARALDQAISQEVGLGK